MRLPSLLALFCFAALQFCSLRQSYADTYQVVYLDRDIGRLFRGMDDSGHVVLDLLYPDYPYPPGCGPATPHCYETFLSGVRVPGFSDTLPSYIWDSGTPCTPSVPAGGGVLRGVCNNGRDAFGGWLSSTQVQPDVYVGPSFQRISAGYIGSIYMNGRGDIVFDNQTLDTWFEAINLDAVPAVPEPSSLLLLATGLAGAPFLILPRRAEA